jgi:hypothetical protein
MFCVFFASGSGSGMFGRLFRRMESCRNDKYSDQENAKDFWKALHD